MVGWTTVMSVARGVLCSLVLVVTVLSGCTDADDPEDPLVVDPETFSHEEGKGAIAGLLVDDRFRPIHLTDDPRTEFQARGFVLLQETGEQVRTTENGEFTLVDLPPGTYTVRVQAEGHEAAPRAVTVEPGVFNEAVVQARRVFDDTSSILTQEYNVFKPCEFTLIVIGIPFDCTFDFSGDSARDAFTTNYTSFPQATWLVTEFKANQAGNYEIRIGEEVGSSTGNYAIEEIVEGDYTKIVVEKNGTATENLYGETNRVWTNENGFTTILYVDGTGKGALPVFGGGFGFGVFVAVEGKFLQSLFLGEPEVDLDSYCLLC